MSMRSRCFSRRENFVMRKRKGGTEADNEQGKGGSLAIMRNNKRTQKARSPIDPGPLQIPCQKRPSWGWVFC